MLWKHDRMEIWVTNFIYVWKIQEENLSAMNTDPWYSAYHYSHPPLVERLSALEDLDSKKEN
jgi:Zn-dependent protease with chaperone function